MTEFHFQAIKKKKSNKVHKILCTKYIFMTKQKQQKHLNSCVQIIEQKYKRLEVKGSAVVDKQNYLHYIKVFCSIQWDNSTLKALHYIHILFLEAQLSMHCMHASF